MRKKISIVLVMTMLLNLVPAFGAIMPVSTGIVASATETEPTPGPRTLKVLCIGSSFGVNSVQNIYQIAQNLGATDIVVGVIWRTAATVDVHWQQASGNLPGYEYKKNTTGTFTVRQNQTMLSAIQDEDWDYIVFQQGAEKAAESGSYTDSITNVMNYIHENKTNPDAKVGWNAVWSFNAGSIAANYYNDQETMYYYIINAVKSKILTNPLFDFVVSPGTAIQNARTSYIGPSAFNADSMHLNTLGSYVAGMAWVKKLTGWSLDDLTWAPSSVPAEYIPVIKEAVNAAVEEPYKVTRSSYTPTPDPGTTPTPVPTATPTPGPDGRIVIPLIKDNFETYANLEEATNAGWQINGTDASVTLKATAAPQYHQSVGIPVNMGFYKTFDPVPLNDMGGTSPGKNAKIVVSYDAYMGTGSGAAQAYIRVGDGINGYNAVSIGRRGNASIRYSDSIASGSTDFVVAPSLPKFTKVKLVIKLTDETGKFYDVAYTKVDIYVNDMTTPIADGVDRRMIDPYTKFANRFYIGGAAPTEIDNVDVSLVVDSDNMPQETPEPEPTSNPAVVKTALLNMILTAQNRYALANAHAGDGEGQYDPSKVSALSAGIESALAVYNNPHAAQNEVDAATSGLQPLIEQCTPSLITSVLANKIAEAQALYETASQNIGTGVGQYNSTAVSNLQNAIGPAQNVYNTATLQSQFDAAVATLQTYINACVPVPPPSTATPEPTATPTPTPGPYATIIIDNTDSGCTFDAAWPATTYTPGYYGLDYTSDGNATGADPAKWAKWTPNITLAGTYNIYMWWTSGTNRPDAAPLEIKYGDEIDQSKTVNQQQNNGQWVFIGTYDLTAGTDNYVKILASDSGATIADAVKFECIELAEEPTPTPVPGVNKVDLEKMLFEGQSLYDYAILNVGDGDDQFDPAVVSALYSAIAAGWDVYNDSDATQEEVDDATDALVIAKANCIENGATPQPTEEPTPEPTITPTPEPTSTPQTIETVLLNENFESYTNISEVFTAASGPLMPGGWVSPVPSPIPTYSLQTGVSQFLRASGGQASSYLVKTFTTAVPLKAGALPKPGPNAKLVFETDFNVSGGKDGTTTYLSIGSGTGLNATAVRVRRTAASAARLGVSATMAPENYLLSDQMNSNDVFTKIKVEISITDSMGNYLAKPKVNMYASNAQSQIPVLVLADAPLYYSSQASVDRFVITGGNGVKMDIDNLKATLVEETETRPTAVPLTVTRTVAQGTGTGAIRAANGLDTVDAGGAKSFFIAPDAGMLIESVMVKRGSNPPQAVTADQVYDSASSNRQLTLTDIAENSEIIVKFYDPLVGTSTPEPTAEPTPEPTAEPVDKSILETTITDANALFATASANTGTAPGQYDQTVVTALSSAIASAQAVLENPSVIGQDVAAAIAALLAAMEACVPNPDVTPTAEPTAEPTVEPTPEPTVEPTVTPDPIDRTEIQLISENFSGYTNVSELAEEGWTVTDGAGTSALVTFGDNGNILQLKGGASASIMFSPVPIKAAGGASPGKNARLEFEFDAYMTGGTGATRTYYRLDRDAVYYEGAVAKTYSVFAMGRKAGRSSFEYSHEINSASATYVVANTSRLNKIKAIITITDQDGNFLASPRVWIWNNGQLTLGDMSIISSGITSVDKFFLGSGSGTTTELDNVSLKLITEDTAPVQRTITTAVDPGQSGTISASTTVNNGYGKTIVIKPATGMSTEYLKVGGVAVDPANIKYNTRLENYYYTISDITADTQVNVKYYDPTAPTPEPTVEPTAEPTATPVPVDKSVLEATIGEAVVLFNTASGNTGTEPGQYDPGVVAALSSAISSAQAVFADNEATQQAVDAEVLSLEAAMAGCVSNPATETPEPTVEPTVEPTIEPTPTPVTDYIASIDENIVVNQVTKKIFYPHYKVGTVNYHQLAVIKSKLAAASGYTYELVQSDGVTIASGTYTEPMHKVIVSYEGTPVETYTFVASIQYGDVNGDGAITASDLGLLKKYLMNKTVNAFVKPYGILAADINKQGSGSNTVTATDLGLLKRYLMSKTSYPISEPTVFTYDPTLA